MSDHDEMQPNEAERLDAALQAYADGQLGEMDQARLDALIDERPEVQQRLQELHDHTDALHDLLTSTTPSPSLADNRRAAIRAAAHHAHATRQEAAPAAFRSSPWLGWGIAAGLLLGVGGLGWLSMQTVGGGPVPAQATGYGDLGYDYQVPNAEGGEQVDKAGWEDWIVAHSNTIGDVAVADEREVRNRPEPTHKPRVSGASGSYRDLDRPETAPAPIATAGALAGEGGAARPDSTVHAETAIGSTIVVEDAVIQEFDLPVEELESEDEVAFARTTQTRDANQRAVPTGTYNRYHLKDETEAPAEGSGGKKSDDKRHEHLRRLLDTENGRVVTNGYKLRGRAGVDAPAAPTASAPVPAEPTPALTLEMTERLVKRDPFPGPLAPVPKPAGQAAAVELDDVVEESPIVFERPAITDGTVIKELEKTSERAYTGVAAEVRGREEATVISEAATASWAVVGDDPTPATLLAAVRQPADPVNPWTLVSADAKSTFAIDTDDASLRIAARFIADGHLPPARTVRMEEFVNAFDYHYPRNDAHVFTVHSQLAPSPFRPGLHLARIGVKGKVLGRDQERSAHVVLVVDASGSMDQPDRLPLVKRSLLNLIKQLDVDDHVSLLRFGGGEFLLADHQPVGDRSALRELIKGLQADGATNVVAGLTAGFELARQRYQAGRINQVVLCGDGVANVGNIATQDILQRVAGYRRQGIACTTVGYGIGAYNDDLLEQLANRGDGTYLFIGDAAEADRLGVELAANLQVIARDAKIQVSFDDARVRRWRLIGYENRKLGHHQFRDDTVDAGEVASGQSATALYEVELHDPRETADLGTVAIRYQDVADGEVDEIRFGITGDPGRAPGLSSDPRFYLAAAAAEFAERIRGSEHVDGSTLAPVIDLSARVAAELPTDNQVQAFKNLVRKAGGLPRAP